MLTPSLRRPFESFAGSCVNTPLMAVTNMGGRVYTQVFLGVRGNTLRCPWTKGTGDVPATNL